MMRTGGLSCLAPGVVIDNDYPIPTLVRNGSPLLGEPNPIPPLSTSNSTHEPPKPWAFISIRLPSVPIRRDC